MWIVHILICCSLVAYKTTSKLSEAQNRKTVEGMQFKNTSDGFLEEGWRDKVEHDDDIVKPAKTAAEAHEELLSQGVAKPRKTVAQAQEESLEEQIREKQRYIWKELQIITVM